MKKHNLPQCKVLSIAVLFCFILTIAVLSAEESAGSTVGFGTVFSSTKPHVTFFKNPFLSAAPTVQGASIFLATTSTSTEPTASSTPCIDSDGGRYYHVKGTVTVNQNSVTDYCTGSTLTEKMCYQNSNGSWTYKAGQITCPNGCIDGACNPTATTQNVESMSSCSDTDVANDVNIKGSVSFGGLEGTFNDYCASAGQSIVYQRSCYHEADGSWNYITSQTACQTGATCHDGICAVSTTPAAQCGNAIVESGEECDDGNANDNNDGCLSICQKCAAPGLQANIYGGSRNQCCTGLVLQGGLCNVPTPTPTPTPTTTQALPDLAPGMIAADTSDFEVNICNKGTLVVSSFDFNVTTNNVSKTLTYAPSLEAGQCVKVHTWGYSYYNITAPWSGNVDVTVDPLNTVSELNETNNTLSAKVFFGMPGIPVPEPPTPTTTPPNAPKKFAICHYTEGKGYMKIEVDGNGWINGHMKHEQDFIIDGSHPCITTSQQPTITTDTNSYTQELLDRIKRLEFKVTQLEQQVVEQEKNLVERVNQKLAERLKGRILLQVENKGEAWYVDPITSKKFYLKDGESAYQALQAFGLGITDQDLKKIPEQGSTTNGNPALVNKLKGKILLQVQQHGEAWYVNPVDGKRYYLSNGDAAYQIMRGLSLGITNVNLRQIAVGSLDAGSAE